ncbi:MAG: hypothetical protein AUJ12_04180 [Alphaproteobacteria bacterium CG1_02_46_17]|nr:MAG: hypothetical protein AUJ12_04180 [Alphaproteobacteria bacterium CG1_02_46_17]
MRELNTQVKFLIRSCEHFDQGDEDEAKRLATHLRTLLHDKTKSRSRSLLSQLGIKEDVLFIDSGIYRDKLTSAINNYYKDKGQGIAVAGHSPMDVGLVIPYPLPDGTFGWKAPCREFRFHQNDPRFGAQSQPNSFKTWWETPLIEASSLLSFSRKNIVLIMANQDGGAHSDPMLDKDYADLCNDFLGCHMIHGDAANRADIMKPGSEGLEPVKNNIAYASVRQITFEVIETLYRNKLILDKPASQTTPFLGMMPIVLGVPLNDTDDT